MGVVLEQEGKKFYQYRVRIELKNCVQLTMDNFNVVDEKVSLREEKNKIFRNLCNYIICYNDDDSFIKINKNKKQYLLHYETSLSKDLIVCKLGRQIEEDFSDKQKTFIDGKRCNYPYSTIIINMKDQYILVEKNYKFFNKPKEMENILENVLNYINCNVKESLESRITINIVTELDSFIKSCEKLDMVEKVSLTLNSPNCFLGSDNADEILSELEQNTDTKKTKIELSSNSGIKGGNLFDVFKSFFVFISNGGGKWTLKGKRGEVTETIYSEGKVVSEYLKIEYDDNMNIINREELRVKIEESTELRIKYED